jgi:phosphate-selective porin OprO/OprP
MQFPCFLAILFLTTISCQSLAQSKLETLYRKGIVINAYSDTAKQKPIFQLKPSFRFQTRFETSGDVTGDEKWESNFLIRRARLKFEGFILTPNLVYKVQLGFSANDQGPTTDFKETGGTAKVLRDAVVKWRFQKNLTLWVGQTKLPGNRSRIISSQSGQLVDRSPLNATFNLDRDVGIQLHGEFIAGPVIIRPVFSLEKGEGRNILTKNIGGYSYTGKLELLPLGSFTNEGDYFEADLEREPKPKLALAASANFNQGASRQNLTGTFLLDTAGEYMTNDLLTIFADALFKYKGFSFQAEYAFKKILLKSGQSLSASDSTIVSETGRSYHTGQGISVQTGYLFKHNIELAARFTTVIPDWGKSFTGSTEYTMGISKYIVGHQLKVQTDVTLIDARYVADHTIRYRLQMEFAF